jgi:hypothetical protein
MTKTPFLLLLPPSPPLPTHQLPFLPPLPSLVFILDRAESTDLGEKR